MNPNPNRAPPPHSVAPPTSRPWVSSAPVQQPQSSPSSTELPVDALISVLQQGFARLEAKLDSSDQRTVPPSSRPNLEPPYEMQGAGWSPPWPSGSFQTPSTAVTLPAWSSGEDSRRGFFGPHGSYAPRTSDQQGPTAWDSPGGQHGNRALITTHTAWDRPVANRGETYGLRSSCEPTQSRGGPPHTSSAPSRYMRLDPPMFDGSDAQSWVTRVQYYFDYIMLPLDQRLHSVIVLFSPPTSDWIFAYRDANPHVSWPQFLDDVRRRLGM